MLPLRVGFDGWMTLDPVAPTYDNMVVSNRSQECTILLSYYEWKNKHTIVA